MDHLALIRLDASSCADDLAALQRVAEVTFVNTFGHLYRAEDLSAYLQARLSPHAIQAEVADPGNVFYGVYLAGVLVGYLKLMPGCVKHVEGTPQQTARPCFLERFYLLPEWQGVGLAQVMLAFVLQVARRQLGADSVHLTVWEENYRAQRFYQQAGFRTVRKVAYPVGQQVDTEFLYQLKF